LEALIQQNKIEFILNTKVSSLDETFVFFVIFFVFARFFQGDLNWSPFLALER